MNDRGVRMTTKGEPMSGETQDVGLSEAIAKACPVCGAKAGLPCTYAEDWPADRIRAGDPATWVHRNRGIAAERVGLTEGERNMLANEVLGRADPGRWDAVERIVAARVAAERERANTAEAKIAAASAIADDLYGVTGARYIADAIRAALDTPREDQP